jgi:hypothetical protein
MHTSLVKFFRSFRNRIILWGVLFWATPFCIDAVKVWQEFNRTTYETGKDIGAGLLVAFAAATTGFLVVILMDVLYSKTLGKLPRVDRKHRIE